MANEHKTVVLSIFGTLLSALIILLVTIGISGGFNATLVEAYVLPLLLAALPLAVFAGILFARQKGKIPGFSPDEEKEKKSADEPAKEPPS